ncbi:MAG: hypothetical protein ACYCOU_01500 [Sulfobacillus sp.]
MSAEPERRIPNEPTLANSFLDGDGKPTVDPVGWWASEKFDGERAVWDGQQLRSRNGQAIAAPPWFLSLLPNIPLDGELYLGKQSFQMTGLFRQKAPDLRAWLKVKYMVFDLFCLEGTFEERQEQLREVLNQSAERYRRLRSAQQNSEFRILAQMPGDATDPAFLPEDFPVILVEQTRIGDKEMLDVLYRQVLAAGGEGLVLRCPGTRYAEGRTRWCLKYKPHADAEGVIVGYRQGNGRNAGRLGSFIVRPLDERGIPKKGLDFGLSGMTDAVRNNYQQTHPIGTVVIYRYRSLTDSGKPRFPSYKGTRGFFYEFASKGVASEREGPDSRGTAGTSDVSGSSNFPKIKLKLSATVRRDDAVPIKIKLRSPGATVASPLQDQSRFSR